MRSQSAKGPKMFFNWEWKCVICKVLYGAPYSAIQIAHFHTQFKNTLGPFADWLLILYMLRLTWTIFIVETTSYHHTLLKHGEWVNIVMLAPQLPPHTAEIAQWCNQHGSIHPLLRSATPQDIVQTRHGVRHVTTCRENMETCGTHLAQSLASHADL